MDHGFRGDPMKTYKILTGKERLNLKTVLPAVATVTESKLCLDRRSGVHWWYHIMSYRGTKIILKNFKPKPLPSVDRRKIFYSRHGSIMKWNKITLQNFRMFQCFIFTRVGVLLVPAHPGSPGQRAVKRLLCVCVCHIMAPHSNSGSESPLSGTTKPNDSKLDIDHPLVDLHMQMPQWLC